MRKRKFDPVNAGILAMALLVVAFIWAYQSHHDAHCGGCDWFWCHLYTGGGDI